MSLESVVGRIALPRHINDGIYADPDHPKDSLKHYTERTIQFLLDACRLDQAREEAAKDDLFRPLSDQADRA